MPQGHKRKPKTFLTAEEAATLTAWFKANPGAMLADFKDSGVMPGASDSQYYSYRKQVIEKGELYVPGGAHSHVEDLPQRERLRNYLGTQPAFNIRDLTYGVYQKEWILKGAPQVSKEGFMAEMAIWRRNDSAAPRAPIAASAPTNGKVLPVAQAEAVAPAAQVRKLMWEDFHQIDIEKYPDEAQKAVKEELKILLVKKLKREIRMQIVEIADGETEKKVLLIQTATSVMMAE